MTFPYHRCTDYRSSSLPYELSVPVEKESGLYCMTLTFKGPIANPSTCYSLLSTQGASRLIIGVREYQDHESYDVPCGLPPTLPSAELCTSNEEL